MADPMTEARLNMILAAEDQAGPSISDLLDLIAKIGPAGTDAADALSEGFASVTEAIDAATATATELLGLMDDVAVRVGAAFSSTGTAIGEDVSQGAAVATEAVTATAARIGEAMDGAYAQMAEAMGSAVQESRAMLDGLGSMGRMTFDDMATSAAAAGASMADSMATATAQVRAELDATAATAEETAALTRTALGGATLGSSYVAPSTTGKPRAHGAGGLMGAVMTGWMAQMGIQMLAQSAMGPTDILATMRTMGGGTPGEAERLMGMLGVAGIQSSAVPGFLSGLSSKLQGMSTFIGAGGLPKEALLAMQNMGYTGSNPFMQIASLHSPGQQINALMSVYSKLNAQGMGSAGSAMLSQLGLGQLAPIAPQWQSLQKQFSGFNLGMTTKQLQQHATQGTSLQASLVQLGMTFSMLASALAPAAKAIVKAINDMAAAFAGGGGKGGKGGAPGGGIGQTLKAVAEGLAAIQAVKFGRAIFDTIATTISNASATIQGAASVFSSSMTADGEEMSGAETAAAASARTAGAAFAGGALAIAGVMAGSLIASGAHIHGAAAAFISVGVAAMTRLAAAFGPWGLVIEAVAILVILAIEHWGSIKHAAEAVGAAIVSAWRSVKKHLGDWVDGLGAAIAALLAALQHASARLVATLAQWAQKMKQAVEQLLAGIGEEADNIAAAIGQFVQTIRDAIIKGVPQLLSHAKDIVQNFIDDIGLAIDSMGADILSAAKNFVSTIWDGIKTAFGSIGGLLGDLTGGGKGSPLTGTAASAAAAGHPLGQSSIASILQYAEQKAGVASKWGSAGMQDLMWMVQRESGGVPTATNPTGVNYGGGYGVEHAQGLLQLMPTTFNSYGGAAYGGITDPVANAISAVNYIMSRYGSPQNIPGVGTGAYKGYATGGIIDEPIFGVGASGRHYRFGESGAEAVVPLGAGGGSGGGTRQLALTVTVNSNTPLGRQAAQEVAREIVNQLKLRGKFDMGPA